MIDVGVVEDRRRRKERKGWDYEKGRGGGGGEGRGGGGGDLDFDCRFCYIDDSVRKGVLVRRQMPVHVNSDRDLFQRF